MGIVIVDYDPTWPGMFASLGGRLRAVRAEKARPMKRRLPVIGRGNPSLCI
jgi:hypothetical protein